MGGVAASRIGHSLRAARARAGFTREALAYHSGVSWSAIAQIESFDRGFYTGAVGWVDAQGDGEWAVAIRSAEVTDQSLRLYAGAGIVGASRPELELAETSAKFQTLLRGMGLDLTL